MRTEVKGFVLGCSHSMNGLLPAVACLADAGSLRSSR